MKHSFATLCVGKFRGGVIYIHVHGNYIITNLICELLSVVQAIYTGMVPVSAAQAACALLRCVIQVRSL